MRLFITFSILLSSIFSIAQDIEYARVVIDTLSSKGMLGRGYVKDGHNLAADFIANEFKRFGLERFDNDFKQEFMINVNTFPGEMDVFINDDPLVPGVDFLVDARCPSIEGEFKLVRLNEEIVGNEKKMQKFANSNLSSKFIIVDPTGVKDKKQIEFMRNMVHNPFNAKGIIMVQDRKLTWSISQEQMKYPVLYANKTQVPDNSKKIMFSIKAKHKTQEITQNVIGYVKGSEQPDSFIVFTGHYDHLGPMGYDVYFPGANDNASGVAMLLDLAYYYSRPQNKPKYSILFIAFGAEEIGLLGSAHYVQNPYFPLSQIKFLYNIDIMGDASKGITLVNGSLFEEEFNLISAINEENGYLEQVKQRGKAANSDHHHFTEKDVKAFFMYSEGNCKNYHDIYDKSSGAKLGNYENVFKLVTEFVTKL